MNEYFIAGFEKGAGTIYGKARKGIQTWNKRGGVGNIFTAVKKKMGVKRKVKQNILKSQKGRSERQIMGKQIGVGDKNAPINTAF